MSGAEIERRWLARFAGIERLYGRAARALMHKRAAVIGLGGTGSWAAEALVRSGLGAISLIDLDDICLSNSNRQSQALQSTVGQLKVEVLAARLRDINPDCRVEAVPAFASRGTTETLLRPAPDGVLDCIDSVQSKAHLLAHCRRHKIPVVSTGGAGGRVDPTAIVVSDLSKTSGDRLSAKLRALLRRDHGFSKNPKRSHGVAVVHSTEPIRYLHPDGVARRGRPAPGEGGGLDCDGGLGASMAVTSAFGGTAANVLIERLLRPAPARGEGAGRG